MKIIFVFILVAGCASQLKLRDPSNFTSNECHMKFRENMDKDTDAQLDHASDLFREHCYDETIQIADHIRRQRRDKYYSMTAEVAEVFTPEGSFTPYILESYERSYLTLLISASHLNMGREEAALVELRQAVNDENARLYNHGEDPVISFLLAALWDRFDSTLSRPHWQGLADRRGRVSRIGLALALLHSQTVQDRRAIAISSSLRRKEQPAISNGSLDQKNFDTL